jgi:two-component system, NtrC family, response regulator
MSHIAGFRQLCHLCTVKYRVLIIDDEAKLRGLLARILSLEGYTVYDVADISSGMRLLERQPVDVVLCDVKLPDGNGVDTAKMIRQKYPGTEIVLLTAYGNIPDSVQAIKNGAFNYIVKGDDNDKIIPLVNSAAEKAAQQRRAGSSAAHTFDTITGDSAPVKAAIQLAKKVAASPTPVLLTGETGTGKEIFAEAIHAASQLANAPFVAFNCSAFSKDIMESELFGHKAGAFTGAAKDKRGLIEEAKGGTLFLDEIGEMPLELQPKLLRFLENGSYYRVGDPVQHRTTVRVIAATNRDLKKEAEQGRFRSDLYYRLAVFTIALPPLRDRLQDVPALANEFCRTFAASSSKPMNGLSANALQYLRHYDWPGNVRELKNVIERAVILEDSDTITPESLPFEIIHPQEHTDAKASFQMANVEKEHIKKVLAHTQGNKAEAARLLGISLATLYRKIDEYSLKG